MGNLSNYSEKIVDLILMYAPRLVLAIVVLIIGLWVIKFAVRGMNRLMEKSEVELSLRKFLSSIVNLLLKVLLLISVASMVGIATTSFVAILGAAGLAVGLALQGSLANFAGGVLLLLFKPIKIGDFIEAQGFSGRVDEVGVFNTILKTPDNKTIIIPNGTLSNGAITNYSSESERRVDMTFGISYQDDITKAKKILNHLVQEDARIMHEPSPQVVVSGLGESSVNFAVRVWCKATDYWDIYFDMQEKIKQTFDRESITIPFPQSDVYLHQAK